MTPPGRLSAQPMWNAPTLPCGCHGPDVANLQWKGIIETQGQGGQAAEMQPPTFHQQAAGVQPLTQNQREVKPLMDVDIIADCIRRAFSKRRFEKKPSATLSAENSPSHEKESVEAEVPKAMEAPEFAKGETLEAVEAQFEKESVESEVSEALEAPKFAEAETPGTMEAPNEKESAGAEVPEAMEAPELMEAETPEVVEAPVEKESAEAEVPEAMEAPKFAEVETPGTMEAPNEKENVKAETPYKKDVVGEETQKAMEVPYERESAEVKALATSDEKDFAKAEALAMKLANEKTYLCPELKPTKGFIPFANTMSAKRLMKDRLSTQPSKPSTAKKEPNADITIPSPKASRLEKRKVYKGPKPEAIVAEITIIPKVTKKPPIIKENEKWIVNEPKLSTRRAISGLTRTQKRRAQRRKLEARMEEGRSHELPQKKKQIVRPLPERKQAMEPPRKQAIEPPLKQKQTMEPLRK
ncbi:uncharacterized protein LOC127241227 [Andrographis paniculata]|uniref:uncharacterized protein LOC127241227 n=1 Tax=Andrographis paniculata TaxID=175694 RepID=UPI0021E70748|nr:uncharacterized protein LOC127241227 [Andrographis paniculata]